MSPDGEVLVPEEELEPEDPDCDEPDWSEPDWDEPVFDEPEADEPDVDVSPGVAEGDWLGVEEPLPPDAVPVEGVVAVCGCAVDGVVCGAR